MWLLDANMDVHLVQRLGGRFQTLRELGVSCDTAANRGWKALSNGELVSAAVAAGFTCLLTRDQLFGESAARALKPGDNSSRWFSSPCLNRAFFDTARSEALSLEGAIT